MEEAELSQQPLVQLVYIDCYYSVFLINHAGILENLRSNMAQKSVLNDIFTPFGGLGSVRNGFAMYFSSRLSPSKLPTASKWSQNPFVSP